jgi:hypothetical protein
MDNCLARGSVKSFIPKSHIATSMEYSFQDSQGAPRSKAASVFLKNSYAGGEIHTLQPSSSALFAH